MKKKIIAFILCVCLISSFCIQPAYAMGAEGAIIGGGAAAGITLSMPQVAMLIAASFGLIYAANHADEIAAGLNQALTNAAGNIENGMEQLTEWQSQATKGAVALATAPVWIMTAIKLWIRGLYTSDNTENIAAMQYAANEYFCTSLFWGNAKPNMCLNVPCTVLRAGLCELGTDYHTIRSRCVAVSTEPHGLATAFTYDGKTYYYRYWLTALNPVASTPLAGSNLEAWEAVQSLPNISELRDKYADITVGADELMILAWIKGAYNTGSVCPDAIVGGVEDAIGNHGIDNIKMPDLDVGGSKLLTPDVAGGSIDDVLDNTLTGLKENTIGWEEYMQDVGVGTPSVSIPQEGNLSLDFPITDTGVSDIPIDTTIPSNPSVEVPEGLGAYTIELTEFFPFCIPFDIVDFVNVLCAEPEAPSFDWEVQLLGGETHKLTIDLSPFDPVAQILRNMELLLFCIGLALMTRNQIRG